jgi:Tfp pilus assembly protein PilF
MIKQLKTYMAFTLLLTATVSFAQNLDKAKLKAEQKAVQKAQDFVYEANSLLEKEDFVAAEMEYRKAISKQENNVAGAYNLAHTYYKKGSFDEALFRSQEAAKSATTKAAKQKM